MKHRHSLIAGSGCTVIFATIMIVSATLPLHAQTWRTMDDFQHTAGLSAVSGDIGTDPHGNLYAVGSGTTTADGSGRVALLNVSADQGATWINLPAFPEPSWSWSHFRAFTSDASGRLFIGGNGTLAPSQVGSSLVRESVDGGVNWTTADDFDMGCADIKVHPATGDVYASGSSATLGRVIRKRPFGASQFSTVYSSGSSDVGSGWSISFHPADGRVFVTGDKPGPLWIVQRSATGDSGSWTTVDTFYSRTEWTQGSARASAITDAGTIYVAGWAYSTKTGKRQWLVRSSADGGATWSISDNFSFGGATVELSGMALDAAGNIFVCGQAANSSGKLYWLVRKGTPTTKLVKQGGKYVQVTTVTWATSDVFQFAPGQEARANGVTGDDLGNVFVSGRAADVNGVDHWVVRKLTP